MSKYIATKLHKAIELAPDEEFFQRCARLPHYVVDPSLVDLLTRGDVQASINAMVEANIAHLPFEKMLIEFETGTTNVRCFVILAEHHDAFRAEMAVIHKDGAAEVDTHPFRLALGDRAISVEEPTRLAHETWMRSSALALTIALLMLNIQGIEKELIKPTRLNRQRTALGKPSVPTHTVMRIGHVYDSEGNRHNLNGGSGRVMPVHMRAGHARHQHYGEGNMLTKIIYIPPVLVNFRPDVEIRQPKRVLAA